MSRPSHAATTATTILSVVLALASAAGALTVRDMLGRDLTLPAPPRRIVSLVPSVTETIFALGGEDRLVGVTDFCDYPPAARQKTRVGGMVAPSLEAVAALRPDLVIGTTEGTREETFVQLVRLGIPTFLVAVHRLADMHDMIVRLGEVTGRQAAVGPLVARLDARIDAVRRAVATRPRPRVLYVVWPDPLIVPGAPAHVTELIALAGGQSITAAERQDYPRFSLEAAIARAPDVIVLADHGASASGSRAGVAEPEKWRAFSSLPAIKAGRLHSVDGNVLHRYGPRVVDGLEQLARAIHPEAFR
jgi:iron complex transport system substrate-binding protein